MTTRRVPNKLRAYMADIDGLTDDDMKDITNMFRSAYELYRRGPKRKLTEYEASLIGNSLRLVANTIATIRDKI